MTTYSRRSDHVATGRAYLIKVRSRPDTDLPTYGEFAAVYGGIGRAAAPVLRTIARACVTRVEPELSILVVNARTWGFRAWCRFGQSSRTTRPACAAGGTSSTKSELD